MSEFIEKSLIDILAPHQGNAIYTKKNIVTFGWVGDIPVISSDVYNNGILCYISKDKLQNQTDLVDCPCITWTVDGAAGKLTVRNYPFVPNNHCGWLVPKVEGLSLDYLVLILQPLFYNCAKNSSNKKVGNNQIEKLIIKIPINDDASYDLDEQNRLVGIYSEIENQKQRLLTRINELEKLQICIDDEEGVEYINVPLNDIVTHHNGKSSYTKIWCQKHNGTHPVYSANNFEPLGFVDTFDYDGDYLTYSKNGCAGYITIISGQFSINGDRCIMTINDEYRNYVDLLYLKYYLEPIFRQNKKGRLGIMGKNEFTKLNSSMIKKLDIQIPIPLKGNGSFDVGKQQEIANKYRQVEEIKQGIISQLKSLVAIKVVPE